jgi:predicted amidohydrolase
MRIALASSRVATSLDDGLAKIEACLADAAHRGAAIVCFPEAYLPGLRGVDFDVLPLSRAEQEHVQQAVGQLSRQYTIATILGTEELTDAGRLNVAVVFDSSGRIVGRQTKNQVAPSEDPFYIAGTTRQLFEVDGVKFGIAICHEGFRYPETVRWAAVRGAKVVFHPHQTGSNRVGTCPTRWGAAEIGYYERAMMMRSIENTIYFASVNYALRFPESATSLIGPAGDCLAYLPYGEEGVLVHNLDIAAATGLIASRYAPERYREARADTAGD